MKKMTNSLAKNDCNFICKKCDFKCSKQSNYEKHLITRKHKTHDNSLQSDDEPMSKKYECICGKEYPALINVFIDAKPYKAEPGVSP